MALIGSPNSGKTTLFNALTGLRAKTANYPGVTVSRSEGVCPVDGQPVVLEDVPGTYSLDPVSPDEQIVSDLLHDRLQGVARIDGLISVADATTLHRSLVLLAHVLNVERPTCLVVTFLDALAQRQGHLDTRKLSRAIGIPVVGVIATRGQGLDAVRDLIADPSAWSTPVVPPPIELGEVDAWIESVLAAADYRPPLPDSRTSRVDAVLLHPVWGTLTFLVVMFAFFQSIFTLAAPLQDWVAQFFGWLGGLVSDHISNRWVSGLIGDALIGGVGGVITFLPQILLLFVLISLLESVGYMARAAFLMDRVMARARLDGRAFVALLSSVACAIPGIMATRTLPSAKDRLATMMAAPLMTCSARLPVYVMLIGMLVRPGQRIGPFPAQGTVMFLLYLAGAISAMLIARVWKSLLDRRGTVMPFYMELPPYRMPSLRSVALAVWDAASAFLRKVTRIILLTTLVLWLLLNLPARSDSALTQAGVDAKDQAAVSAYVIDHSPAAAIGRAVEPVFRPLGFDWRINIGVLASLSARETFVSTLGMVASSENPEKPAEALEQMTVQRGPDAGRKLFDAGTIAAMLVFFIYALQCMSTIAILRRESGAWKWPAMAFGYLFALAWVLAWLARLIVNTVRG
ncbi:MAG TPA: ferrous iron transporter B [Ilumatobacteraceae bacterium]|nr:ferrous iron transporter B [Ilumatobacteraceae bacterium]